VHLSIISHTGKIYLFLLVPAIIVSLTFEPPVFFKILKPLIIPLLIIEVYQKSRSSIVNLSLFRWLYAALILSWLGDAFLMFEARDSSFFILGLSSFLMAHIGYMISIIITSEVTISKSIKSSRSLYLVFIVAYAMLFLSILYPGLGEMQFPVFIYAFVIMAMVAMSVLRSATGSLVVLAGAVLFVLSDSTLAYAKFINTFPGSRELTMLTYMLAQFLLVQGLLSTTTIKA